MNIGHNSDSGKQLQAFVERIEAIRAAKQTMSDDEASVMAEAKLAGFVPKGIRAVVKIRAAKPHDQEEFETLVDTYRHALGEARETPLFRQVGLMGVDIASRDAVVEAMKPLVPANGSIVVEVAGVAVKLTRDQDGKVEAKAHDPHAVAPASSQGGGRRPTIQAPQKDPPPDVTPEAAQELGAVAHRENLPIIANPFPFGDARRARWDQGWRKESGTDGMGPDD